MEHKVLMTKLHERKLLEVGDLVRVADNTHQEGLPLTRVGVVTGVGIDASGLNTGVYQVLFASSEGQVTLQFWHKFLEKVV